MFVPGAARFTRVMANYVDDGGTLVSSLHRPAELLPIARHRESLLYAIETSRITVVVGHTGCGKSTQIPQFLFRAGWGKEQGIAVTQVRTPSKLQAFVTREP